MYGLILDKLSLDLGPEEYARILTHLLKGIHKQSSKPKSTFRALPSRIVISTAITNF